MTRLQDASLAEWRWEDHPEVGLSDSCANGACQRCVGTFIDHYSGQRAACGHPCHDSRTPSCCPACGPAVPGFHCACGQCPLGNQGGEQRAQ